MPTLRQTFEEKTKPQFGGVRGRSGRKSWDKERDLHRLWDLSVPILVNALTAPRVRRNVKEQIALELLKKMTPTLAALPPGAGFGETRIIIVRDSPKSSSPDDGNQTPALSGPFSLQRS